LHSASAADGGVHILSRDRLQPSSRYLSSEGQNQICQFVEGWVRVRIDFRGPIRH